MLALGFSIRNICKQRRCLKSDSPHHRLHLCKHISILAEDCCPAPMAHRQVATGQLHNIDKESTVDPHDADCWSGDCCIVTGSSGCQSELRARRHQE